jgi:dienelactone hydrolase
MARDDVTQTLTDWSPFKSEGLAHDVHVVGSGPEKPALILMHELPGLTPQCLELAERLRDEGFVVYMPLLMGTIGKRATLRNLVRLCIAREFTRFCKRGGYPVTRWLRALGLHVRSLHGSKPIGVIGMCMTGGFVLSMSADEHVLAGVSCQPSYPFPLPGKLERSLGATWLDMRHAARNTPCRVLGLRFENDRISPPERFGFLAALLGERFRAITLPSDTPWIKRSAHSVLTDEYQPWRGHPTRNAFDEVVVFLRMQLQ